MKSKTQKFHRFTDYWPLYVENHKRKLTQQLHFYGLLIYFLSWLPGFFYNFWWGIPVSLVFGYLLSFYTHLYIEKSPINLKHPYWGLVANLYMFWLILTFKMEKEMKRLYGDKNNLN